VSVTAQTAANKHKAMGLLFDAKGKCVIEILGQPRVSVRVLTPKDEPAKPNKYLAAAAAKADPPTAASAAAATTVAPATASTETAIAATAASKATKSSPEIVDWRGPALATTTAAKVEAKVHESSATTADADAEQPEEEVSEKAARRAAMKAKIAAKYVAAKAASEGSEAAIPSELPAPPAATKPSAKTFARGDAVLYDNPKNGKLEFAHVHALHTHEGVAEYYTIQTNNGEKRQVEGDRLSGSSWSAPIVFDEPQLAEAPKAVVHVHPYAPPGGRIGVGHHNFKGKLNFHGPKQVHVPHLDLTVRGIGGNGKSAATMGYAAWKKTFASKKQYA